MVIKLNALRSQIRHVVVRKQKGQNLPRSRARASMAYSCLQDGQRPGYLEHRNGRLQYTVRSKVGWVVEHLWTTLWGLDVIVNMVGCSLTVVRWGQMVPNIVGDDRWNRIVERFRTRQKPRVKRLRETLKKVAIMLATGVVVEDGVHT